ncbi:MAG TPA: HAMP domain-containing sensor histidine kinase [Ramlibacter sp.]|jgi:signal transduction histidine kinase|uniref:sensor histidine kinase n=1 Tax=Ramlibacter sp. TaxID=1917967 RepID=UPI002D4C4B24|nr:HAMP domain-containing sensor histidine kinase [Ramlibacter sp.]HZY20480.1 HAMP domain-containing sensor histidine kinase [Ramlibacter sp.]
MLSWFTIPDAARERPVFAVMFRCALQGARSGLVGGTLLAGAMVWMFWEQRTRPQALAWMAAVVLVIASRVLMLRRWGRLSDDQVGQPQCRAMVLGYLTAGVTWGLAGWVFHPHAPDWARYALVASQYTMLVMSVVALSWYLPAFVAFATPAALLIPVPWLLHSPHVGWVVAIGTLFNYGAWLAFARRHATTQADSLRIRFERQELVQQLERHAQDMELAHRAKTRFLASASHDLRQPLHGMALLLSGARQGGRGLAAASVPAMEAMVRSLEEILDSFIEAARTEAPHPELPLQPCDAQAQVDQVVEELAPLAAQAQLSLRVHRQAGVVRSHPGALLRIVRNLLSNALKYTDAGGVLVALRKHGPTLRLEVWDTGPGIAAQDLERVFRPFERAGARGAPGAGLGLAVVRQLCDALGHRVEVLSRPGRGSLFRVSLGACAPAMVPAAGTAPATDAEALPVLQEDRGPGILLLVRDPVLREHTAGLLDHWELPWQPVDDVAVGARVLQAGGGRLVLVDAAAVREHGGFEVLLAQAALPCVWLGQAPSGSMPSPSASAAPVVELRLPLEPVALRAAVNRLLRPAAVAASPRSPENAS